jgi:hypothetical protein
MNTRSSRSVVTFPNAFALSGYSDKLPAGLYEVVVEEERLQGLSFEVYRRTATFLTVRGQGNRAGRIEIRPITEEDLELALTPDRVGSRDTNHSVAALSPPEDKT